MIELLVAQAFALRVLGPFGKERGEAGLPVLQDVREERVRDLLAVVVLGEGLAADGPVICDFFRKDALRLEIVHGLVVACELDLLVDDIVDELALHNVL